jgi:hypothetical protein
MKLVIIYKRKKYKLEYTLKRRPDNKGYYRPRFIPKEVDIYIPVKIKLSQPVLLQINNLL